MPQMMHRLLCHPVWLVILILKRRKIRIVDQLDTLDSDFWFNCALNEAANSYVDNNDTVSPATLEAFDNEWVRDSNEPVHAYRKARDLLTGRLESLNRLIAWFETPSR